MRPSILGSFLEMGDATSRNLEFAHRPDVHVSYGEETITESNLLELRRRHPEKIIIETFSKRRESKTGADWEWHLVGRRRTLKMRVQAKRIRSKGGLSIKHQVASSGVEQRKLLIDSAKKDSMKPIYCIYCTERERQIWKQLATRSNYESYQTGCLLVNADDVPICTRKLSELERKCIPWHYLFERSLYEYYKNELIEVNSDDTRNLSIYRAVSLSRFFEGDERSPIAEPSWNAPTIHDLNEETGRDFDNEGVASTSEEDLRRLLLAAEPEKAPILHDRERLIEHGISRMIVMDVRQEGGSPREARRFLDG